MSFRETAVRADVCAEERVLRMARKLWRPFGGHRRSWLMGSLALAFDNDTVCHEFPGSSRR